MKHPDRHHVNTVCKPGAGSRCCRYLVALESGFHCGKLEWPLSTVIDAAVAAGKWTGARGDNCEGLKAEMRLA